MTDLQEFCEGIGPDASRENGQKAAREIIAERPDIFPPNSAEKISRVRGWLARHLDGSAVPAMRANGLPEEHIEAWKDGFTGTVCDEIAAAEKAMGLTVLHKRD